LFVGISITLLLESLSNSVLICEWKRKEKNWEGKKELMSNGQKLRKSKKGRSQGSGWLIEMKLDWWIGTIAPTHRALPTPQNTPKARLDYLYQLFHDILMTNSSDGQTKV
jgi:hypothetical protein